MNNHHHLLFLLSVLSLTAIAKSHELSTAERIAQRKLLFFAGREQTFPRRTSQNDQMVAEDPECDTLCNGQPMNTTKCVGRAEVNCIRLEAENILSIYRRACDGSFVNKTRLYSRRFETDQGCKGISHLRMTVQRMNVATHEWDSEYEYKRSCYTKYVMFVQHLLLRSGKTRVRVTSVCVGASETRFEGLLTQPIANLQTQNREGNPRPFTDDTNVTCNSEPSNLYNNCKGVVVANDKTEAREKGMTCKGSWNAIDDVLFECDGKQSYFENTFAENDVIKMSRNCTGVAATSIRLDRSRGYIVCNGEAYFQERFYILPDAPPPPPALTPLVKAPVPSPVSVVL